MRMALKRYIYIPPMYLAFHPHKYTPKGNDFKKNKKMLMDYSFTYVRSS